MTNIITYRPSAPLELCKFLLEINVAQDISPFLFEDLQTASSPAALRQSPSFYDVLFVLQTQHRIPANSELPADTALLNVLILRKPILTYPCSF